MLEKNTCINFFNVVYELSIKRIYEKPNDLGI